MRWHVVYIATLAAVASSSAAANDKIQSPKQAIEVAKQACGIYPGTKGRWSASLHHGIWRVRFDTPSDLQPDAPFAHMTVAAVDGRAGHCEATPY